MKRCAVGLGVCDPLPLFNTVTMFITMGFPSGSDGKEPACKAGDPGSIPMSGRSPGEGNGYPLHYSCLENSVDRRAWGVAAHGVLRANSQ